MKGQEMTKRGMGVKRYHVKKNKAARGVEGKKRAKEKWELLRGSYQRSGRANQDLQPSRHVSDGKSH